jgi:E3 ubiquitin-protein ligase HUWE1
MIRADPTLLTTTLLPFIGVRECRMLMDFSNKRAFFLTELRLFNASRSSNPAAYLAGALSGLPGLPLVLKRASVFQDSYTVFAAATTESLLGRLEVRFAGEEGVDAGGLSREWYEILAREMFNPNYGLFKLSEDGTTYQPNPHSHALSDNHLGLFRFIGRALGKAVMDGQLLDAHFTRSFYKHMLGLPVTYHDIEAVDPQYYKSLTDILGMPIDDLGLELYFTAEQEDAFGGRGAEVELVPGGAAVAVTDANKWEYVSKVAAHKMTASIARQTDAFLAGFHELVPPSLISIFSEAELELLIAGLPNIDIADLRANTEYTGFRPTDEVVQWFWQALESFDQQDRARFLMFVTGTSKVPLGGFKALRGQRGPQKFTLERGYSTSLALPQSHTCFNSLVLTPTDSFETLYGQLLIAIREGAAGFYLI